MFKAFERSDFDTCEPALLILGAGASHPLPTAWELRQWTVELALQISGLESDEITRTKAIEAIHRPPVTLESLFSLFTYRMGTQSFRAVDVLRMAFDISSLSHDNPGERYVTNEASLLVAAARKLKEPLFSDVITTNFDTFLPEAHDLVGSQYNLITLAQATKGIEGPNRIFPVHGTLFRTSPTVPSDRPHIVSRKHRPEFAKDGIVEYSGPTTALARGLARPFPKDYETLIRKSIQGASSIVTYGYSGSDEYDINIRLIPLLPARSTYRR